MRRAFISHTSEFDPYDRNHSFVLEVMHAANSVDFTTVSMRDFPATTYPPAAECKERIGKCDLVIFLIGFKRGTLVPGTSQSYVELEFQTAEDLKVPRLVFMLSDAAVMPLYMGQELDAKAARSQAKFRARLHRSARVTVKSFSTPAELSNSVKDSLRAIQSAAVASAQLHELNPSIEAALKPTPLFAPSIRIPRPSQRSFALAAGFAGMVIASAFAIQAYTQEKPALSRKQIIVPVTDAQVWGPAWTSYQTPTQDVLQGLLPETSGCVEVRTEFYICRADSAVAHPPSEHPLTTSRTHQQADCMQVIRHGRTD